MAGFDIQDYFSTYIPAAEKNKPSSFTHKLENLRHDGANSILRIIGLSQISPLGAKKSSQQVPLMNNYSLDFDLAKYGARCTFLKPLAFIHDTVSPQPLQISK